MSLPPAPAPVPATGPEPRPGPGPACETPAGSERQRIGAAAEARAAACLESAGLRLLARNYRCRMGELDLVACRDDLLVVAEVRLRRSARFGGAAASITWQKRRRIVRATRHLLASQPALQRLRVRFDALLVDGDAAEVEWIRGAFDAGQ